ncbi:DUF2789 domain-containing protein [Chromobacterium amazonense]|uniref:DUF2789 domain-containing protein n=1 Tax=Chromobacterium amazonense TaxID=1382803 RepID=A0A1S1WV07_9NEIS|nr:DUF2789 domain-containing protein [Chromobacterium amazonense]KIA80191.1 hypothetical protein QR66_11945 [Chromobacterium piscinae]MBM2885836.1 DUF2789 domain-containing protein [Chromobacterium amazonense]MDE1713811.1 DUF2789 domain-containing protein [Chromobacterium amazonense]MDQ4542394.1 DUF2789 domain-containing protein [Chromobacterium amazonense]OHX11086.1 hypothetical protein BI343_05780 [Chromobacterium amazonense]
MDTSNHQLPGLFRQLGLADDAAAMRAFIASHPLPPGASLAEAPFWSAAQASFLRQALECDAEWSEAVDELAVLLQQGES